MADTTLILGGIAFKDFEIPEMIRFGGQQHATVHKLLGGDRVVDAMGPDPADISWDGRLQGPDASSRARALLAMYQAGAQVSLSWGGFFFTVMLRQLDLTYERFYQVIYRLSCTVVTDPGGGGGAFSLPISLDDLVGVDMSAAVSMATSVIAPSLQTGVAALDTAISAAGTLQGAATSSLLPLVTQATALGNVAAAVVATQDNGIMSSLAQGVAGVVSGGNPELMAANVLQQVANMAQQAQTLAVQDRVGRVLDNLQATTG